MNEKPVGYSGRPWRYSSKAKLESDINAYFDKCDKEKKPYTMTGLANALDLDRETVRNYRKDELFGSAIARAKGRVEQQWEEMLPYAKGSGVQFNLKNNWGWKDRSEQEITGAGGAPLTTRIIVDYGDDDE